MRARTWLRPAGGVLCLAAILLLGMTVCSRGGGVSRCGPQPIHCGPTFVPQQVLNYVLGGGSNIATLDPALVQNTELRMLTELVFPGLVTLNEKLQVIPWAADTLPTVNTDATTYTFHLRGGMKFSDGEPIDAAAFAYAINRTLDPCTASPVAYYLFDIRDATRFNGERCLNGKAAGPIATLVGSSLIAQDGQTLTIYLQQPTPYFLEKLAYPTSDAVPQNLIQWYSAKWTDHLADGTGFGGNLFKVMRWDHRTVLDLERNDSFWGNRPQLRMLTFTIYKNVEMPYNAYIVGQYDIGVPPSAQYAKAKARTDFHEAPLLALTYLQMNWKDAPFDDLRVRQAFALALDKQRLAANVLHGAVIPTNGIVPQGMPGYDPALVGPDGTLTLSGNVAEAQELAQAYANDRCGGSFAKCPKVLLTTTDTSVAMMNIDNAAVQMWRSTFPGWPISVYTRDDNGPPPALPTQAPQLALASWQADYPDPQDWLSLHFLPGAAYNSGNVSDPAATALMRRADGEQDEAQRLQDYNAAQQMLVTDVAWLPLYQSKTTYLVRPYVEDFSVGPEGLTPLDVWQQVYIGVH